MHLTVVTVATIGFWTLASCLAMWLLTIPLRRRSFVGVLASVVLAGTAASIGAVLGSVRVMLLPAHDQVTLLGIAAVAGVLGAIAAGTAARRIARDRRTLTDAVLELGDGRVPSTDGPKLHAELESVRRELVVTAGRLGDSRERERLLESARRELVAWVSHDLRSPLAGLRAVTEALEDGLADDAELSYKQIRLSVDRLSRMVDDLFDLSRMHAGAFAQAHDPIALDDLLSDCLAALEPLAAAHGVRLMGRSSGPIVVSGSGAELNRALTNLVANAIRHTPIDGRVDVSLGVNDIAGIELAEVIVHDQCGGIAESDLPRVFDIGLRGERALTGNDPSPTGAGLGLAITRGIVEAHRGEVDVANTPVGCQFTISLPIAC